ncbi:MAG: hypothetical protein ACR2RB_10010 [Gammaproteobacteria bacterium]
MVVTLHHKTSFEARDPVPAGLAYVGGSISGGDVRDETDPAGAGLAWTINALAVNTSATLSFRATANPGTGGTPLPEGVAAIQITATDAAGNPSALSSISVTIDTMAPTAPVVTQPTDGELTNDSPVTFAGTAAAGETVRVVDPALVKGDQASLMHNREREQIQIR